MTWFQRMVEIILILWGKIELHQVLVWAVKIDLITVWGIELRLISVCGSELTTGRVFCGGRKIRVSGSKQVGFLFRGIGKIDLLLEWGSNWLNFSGGFEMYLILVPRIEFDFDLGLGSKWTCFCARGLNWLCAGRNWHAFSGVINWFDFCVCCRSWLSPRMRAANCVVFVCALKLTWFLWGCSKLTWFQCVGLILYKRAEEVRAYDPSQRGLISPTFYPS